MAWTSLRFGKHRGKTLPQVIFSDPDWFFWAWEEGVFRKRKELLEEAQIVNRRARTIKITQDDYVGEPLEAEYLIHYPTRKFGTMQIVPASQERHKGSSQVAARLKHIDLSVPRIAAYYDKQGCATLLREVKYHLFGNSGHRMTKKRCEDFFDDLDNFGTE